MKPYITSPEEITDAEEVAVEHLASKLVKPWLNQRECEKYCGVSKATLARWRASGLLAYSKIGQLLFYRREDVDTLLASQNQRPAIPAVAA